MKSMDSYTGAIKEGAQRLFSSKEKCSTNENRLELSPRTLDSRWEGMETGERHGNCFFEGEVGELDQLYLKLRQEILSFKKDEEPKINVSAIRQNLSNLSQNMFGALNLLNILHSNK